MYSTIIRHESWTKGEIQLPFNIFLKEGDKALSRNKASDETVSLYLPAWNTILGGGEDGH